MTDNEEAVILLQYGTVKKYVNSVMKNFNLTYIKTNARTAAFNRYSSAEIGEEWENSSISEFISEGYSRDSVAFETWNDAIYELTEEHIYQEAETLIRDHFNNDKDLIKPVVDYLFE